MHDNQNRIILGFKVLLRIAFLETFRMDTSAIYSLFDSWCTTCCGFGSARAIHKGNCLLSRGKAVHRTLRALQCANSSIGNLKFVIFTSAESLVNLERTVQVQKGTKSSPFLRWDSLSLCKSWPALRPITLLSTIANCGRDLCRSS